LKAAGLYVTPDHLYFVRMRKDLFRLTILEEEAREIAYDGSGSGRPQALSDALRSLLPRSGGVQEPLYVCFSADQAICLEFFLPAVAEAELHRALDYEVERQLPLRPEEVYYDFVAAGRKGEKLKVFLFAVPKRIVDELFEVLSAFGVRPRGVETTFTALGTYFLSSEDGWEPSAVIVGGDKRGWEVVELRREKNSRGSLPELSFSRWFSQAEWSRGAARDLFQGSVRRSPRWYGWGYFADFLRSAEIESLEMNDLRSRGERRFRGGRKLAHPLSVAAAGAALRGLREAAFQVNLLPEARQERKGGRLSWLNEALAVLLLIALGVWGMSYPLRDEIRLRQLQRENRRLEPSVQALRSEEGELERIRTETALLSNLQRRRGEILQILDELSRIVPNNAYLSFFRYRDTVVELQGSAENASNLVPALERSPLLRDVGFTAPSNRGRDSRETFSLKGELEQRPGKANKP
jgi:Tfp pilus assembly protein PilN